MGLLDKFADKVNSASVRSSSNMSPITFPPAAPAPPLGPDSVFRYRKQRGVNLGSWFVLERWIAEKPFVNAVEKAESDHDVARGKDAKRILEAHWDTWVGDEEWKWIKQHGYNSVRLPIGYYHLCSAIPDVLKDTDFEKYHDVFSGAWGRIEKAIETASSHGLGVFVELHAAAGAQNPDAHAGMSKGKADLFNRSANLRSTSLALRFLASYLAPKPQIVGLQLLNEPARDDDRLYGWYETTLNDLRSITGPHFPLYIHDAWWMPPYAQMTGSRSDFVVLDFHLYRCFEPFDKVVNGEEHAHKLRNVFQPKFAKQCDIARGNVVVAEFSGALFDGDKGMSDGERDRNKREFVRAEIELFEKHTAGWWFWTLKKGEGWDAAWNAKDATRAEILPGWVGSGKFKGAPPQEMKDAELKRCHEQHANYWAANGGSPNPAVFAPGFAQGWDDALLFMGHSAGVSEMGFATRWADRRKEEHEQANQPLGPAAWEWETGFKQGVEACQQVALER